MSFRTFKSNFQLIRSIPTDVAQKCKGYSPGFEFRLIFILKVSFQSSPGGKEARLNFTFSFGAFTKGPAGVKYISNLRAIFSPWLIQSRVPWANGVCPCFTASCNHTGKLSACPWHPFQSDPSCPSGCRAPGKLSVSPGHSTTFVPPAAPADRSLGLHLAHPVGYETSQCYLIAIKALLAILPLEVLCADQVYAECSEADETGGDSADHPCCPCGSEDRCDPPFCSDQAECRWAQEA